MNTFKEVKKKLEELPAYPKLYLLGSTGAGKTSVVRSILGTIKDSFPTVSQSRTTVSTTEYVLSKNLQYKATFVFKSEDEILDSINDVITSAILKVLTVKKQDEDFLDEIIMEIEESSDERFRLKYILENNSIQIIAQYILDAFKYVANEEVEEMLSSQSTLAEIKYLTDKIMQDVEEKVKLLCVDYDLFENDTYVIENINSKDEFITKIKSLLKNDINSISPLIKYARIEGNLLATWLPEDTQLILIDGEGIGHDLKENKHSLSTRHLDYFNFCDSILLVEKSDDPFIAGGQSAIETLILNGYSEKLKLLFSKVDLIGAKEPRRVLTSRLRNVKSALEEKNIYFDIKKDKRYYLSSLDKTTQENTQKEIKRLIKNVVTEFEKYEQNIELEYDFNSLLINFNASQYLARWQNILQEQHWTIIKALNKRVISSNAEYRYLKPILEFHTLIMKEINDFLALDDEINSDMINSQNAIKSKFSQSLLVYLDSIIVTTFEKHWREAYLLSGSGSTRERSMRLEKIFNTFVPTRQDMMIVFREKMKNLLLKSGVVQTEKPTKIYIKNIDIKNINGYNNISWDLENDVNILIGKNGTGKSTILQLVDAFFNSKNDVLNRYKEPDIAITINKQYSASKNKDFILSRNSKQYQDIEIVLIDTFDTFSPPNGYVNPSLDGELSRLLSVFSNYQINLKKRFDDENTPIQDKIDEIMSNDGGDLEQAKELYAKKKELEIDIYKSLHLFEDIINSMFKDTKKSINLHNKQMPLTIKTQNSEITVSELSSGEKQILVIFLNILLRGDKVYILIMDEPEISLHVQWQTSFIDNIKRLNNNIQIILATHNPLIMLNRNPSEIGVLEIESSIVQKKSLGTKYLDISSTLLEYFNVNSLVGNDMKNTIAEYHTLSTIEDLTIEQSQRVDEIKQELENTPATNFIYDKKYLKFLKFLKQNKDIDFNKNDLSSEEIDELLKDFKDFLDD